MGPINCRRFRDVWFLYQNFTLLSRRTSSVFKLWTNASPDDTAAVERGVEIIVVGLALMTVKHNVGAVDNLIGLAFSKDEEEEA